MGLYQQVQLMEQRLLMLEHFCLDVATHLNPQNAPGFPMIPTTGFFGPRVDRGFSAPPRAAPRRMFSHEVGENEHGDPDLESLEASLVGAEETSVSALGTTDYGDDNFGDVGDVGGDDGDGGDGAGDGGGDF